uniref:Developmental pluripotency associated 4 n=1 Tax=Saimiri boliviensis boliviensis TaxID=39432 RepID=A0A2K6V2I4_SAIBB
LCPKKAEYSDNPRPQKIPIPPLPSKLPPVNVIHRGILQPAKKTHPPEVGLLPEEGLPALEKSTALLEGANTVVMTTSAPEALLASWARISARARMPETVESPQEACGVQGKRLPADTDVWVHLQFHAGQAWVPEKQEGRVSASNFPPQHLEDNMLCPKCVHRNKVLIKSLQWK